MSGILANQVAIVTGGGTGIGRAIVRRLAQEGAAVAVCGRHRQTLDRCVEELVAENWTAKAYCMDVQNRNEVDTVVGRAAIELGSRESPKIDIVVNNAAVTGYTPISNLVETLWEEIVDTNLNGPMRVTRAALRYMPHGGRMINIASVLGKQGAAGYSAYSASKHGLLGLTRSLALELSSRQITVNAVCPGWVETDRAADILKQIADEAHQSAATVRRGLVKRIPIGRFVQANEVAQLVLYLCQKEAAAVTGQAFSICGGQTSA
ncbi:SDR family oxidoreductase [Desertifilum sp. FACHB-1129]|uniref:3-hydroxyacyl-CoA dehydrogenase n=2 Tax=Cyanophyceae TaxID=3028117 RepID=A0A1E5QNG3_9CYAN|nr:MULTISPECIES: SDR family NAD(P)-dependent oxidoreductase [Cyanophyceae]MCD8489384.1 SDR family oxidoreductase [Desertifilum sp.]MDA0210301.1 SDR family NAD(P)-dependent oxidoreductase [Cyanobacteria bacterium FC1]MDI9640814.1 SDR family NAD(P)-dependent oxidoreductase [Geitlerinema splendidum]MDK3159280.1 SDR family NAD(P)-dependent oxidoreductase [Kamptonema cortianum]MDL5051697.1 SDR family NAD(P)-dependent oxidoreductase [Oscillatoria amoena NRMC-F 0135]